MSEKSAKRRLEQFVSRCGLGRVEFKVVSGEEEEGRVEASELQGSVELEALKISVTATETNEKRLKERLSEEVLGVLGEVADLQGNRLRVKMKENFDFEIPKSALMQAIVLGEKNGEFSTVEEAVKFVCTEISGNFSSEISDQELLGLIRSFGLSNLVNVYCELDMSVGENQVFGEFLVKLVAEVAFRMQGKYSDEVQLGITRILELGLFQMSTRGNSEKFSDRIFRVVSELERLKRLPFLSKSRLIHWLLCQPAFAVYPRPSVAVLRPSVDPIILEPPPRVSFSPQLLSEYELVASACVELFGVRPQLYGSAVNGFSLPGSDLDAVVMSTKADDEIEAVRALAEVLAEKYPGKAWTVQRVENARVPILVVKSAPDALNAFEVNISFNHGLPIKNSRLLYLYSELHPNIILLVRLVKRWAKARGLNDALSGGLSSYAWTLAVLGFLTQFGLVPSLLVPLAPCLPDATIVSEEKEPMAADFFDYEAAGHSGRTVLQAFTADAATWRQRLSAAAASPSGHASLDDFSVWTLFRSFCVFFSRGEFNIYEDAISLNGVVKKSQFSVRRLWFSIIDPLEQDRVLGVSAKGMERLLEELQRAGLFPSSDLEDQLCEPARNRTNQRLPPLKLRVSPPQRLNRRPDSAAATVYTNMEKPFARRRQPGPRPDPPELAAPSASEAAPTRGRGRGGGRGDGGRPRGGRGGGSWRRRGEGRDDRQ